MMLHRGSEWNPNIRIHLPLMMNLKREKYDSDLPKKLNLYKLLQMQH